MKYFIDLYGKKHHVVSSHEAYAKSQLRMSLSRALEAHVRVAVHGDRMCFETSGSTLTARQKLTLGMMYREYKCHGHASRVGDCHYQSDFKEAVKRIRFDKCIN
jgi:hypothetical protein